MRLWLVTLVAACGTARGVAPDAGDGLDAPPGRDDAGGDGGAGYRHTIQLDGQDDFFSAEQFATTSDGYAARVTWDDDALYVGYAGPDLDPAALDTATKWLFVYVDLDPGAATGGAASQRYNTQQAAFPTGFGAELYARWKCDGSLASIEQRAADDSYATVGALTAAQAGDYVELAIPRALLGGAPAIGVVTWMINEKPDFEGSFAGLYEDNFADGYGPALPLTKYLRVDFAAGAAPNDPGNVAP